MRFLDSAGRVQRQMQFTCGRCGRDATPNVEFREGSAPPEDYTVKCPHCGYVCGKVNPRTAAALSVPPAAQAAAEVQAIVDRAAPELEALEAETRADLELEADVAESQRPPRP